MMAKKNEAKEKKEHPSQAVSTWLTQRSDKLAEWCIEGSGIDPMTLIRVGSRLVAMEEKFQNPKTWPSLYIALITAAQLGLEPDGPRGEAYLIPYWDKKAQCHLVQLQPGYRGLMKLITQGIIEKIRSQVVHENDHFEMQLGTNKRVDHQPAWKDRGKPVAVYSLATYTNGDEDYELASWDDVMKAKASAKGKSPAWDNWPEQMARKFVIKRHSNQLPLDPIARKAIAIDNIDSDRAAMDAQGVIDIEELNSASPKTLQKPSPEPSKLSKKLQGRKAKREAPASNDVEKPEVIGTKEQDAEGREKYGDGPPPTDDAGAEPCDFCGENPASAPGEPCERCRAEVNEAATEGS